MSDLRIACELQGWILIEKDSSEKMHNVTQWKSGKQAKIYDGILTLEEFNLRFIFANSANTVKQIYMSMTRSQKLILNVVTYL